MCLDVVNLSLKKCARRGKGHRVVGTGCSLKSDKDVYNSEASTAPGAPMEPSLAFCWKTWPGVIRYVLTWK